MALPPRSMRRPLARRVRWPIDQLHPLAVLATALATVAVLTYNYPFADALSDDDDEGTMLALLELTDPVRSLAKLSNAERLIAQAAKGLPRWVQEHTVGTIEQARADAERRWDDLLFEYEILAPEELYIAELGRATVLAEWGDAWALDELRCAPDEHLADLPPELLERAEAVLCGHVQPVPRAPARAAMAFHVGHIALAWVLMGIGPVAVAWLLIRRRSVQPLCACPAAGTFGLLRGYEIWIWCELMVIAAVLFFALLSLYFGRLGAAAWELVILSTAVPILLLVRYGLLRPQGRTLLGLYAVAPGRGPQTVLTALVLVGLGWSFFSVLAYFYDGPVGDSAWVEWIDEAAQSGSAGLWLLESLGTVVWAPVVEELIYRGVLYVALRKRLSVVPAAVISALIFALAHDVDPVNFVSIMFYGFLYALAYERTRSLAPCVLAHALHNLSGVMTPLPFMLV